MKFLTVQFLVLAVLVTLSPQSHAGLILTAEAPGVKSSQISGVTTETFDGIAIGNYSTLATAVGSFSAPGLSIDAANVFGGAGGVGRFMAVGVQSGTLATSLALATGTPQAYFGFWWSAADAGNAIDIFSGSTLLASFNPVTALGALSSSYNGNPDGTFAGQNSGEKYAYLNFIGTAGTKFDRIVFRNASLFSGFETDNFSIREAEVGGSTGTTIPGGLTPAVPEPSALALGCIGAIGMSFATARRRLVQKKTRLKRIATELLAVV